MYVSLQLEISASQGITDLLQTELSNVPSEFREFQHLCMRKTRNPKRPINFNLKNTRLYFTCWDKSIMCSTVFYREEVLIDLTGTNLVEK